MSKVEKGNGDAHDYFHLFMILAPGKPEPRLSKHQSKEGRELLSWTIRGAPPEKGTF